MDTTERENSRADDWEGYERPADGNGQDTLREALAGPS